jgi:predicted transposase YbfD/YdcC
VPVLDRTRDRAHGRVEIRTLKAVTVRGFGFPHTSQVLQVTRKVRDLGSRRWRTAIVYAVTSLSHAQASPARLADLLRGHWGIETGLHWVRDVTFAEDTSQVRTGSGPHVMAALRNLAIGALHRAGPVNLAAALRHHSRDPHRPLATPGIRLGQTDITKACRSSADEPDMTHGRRNPGGFGVIRSARSGGSFAPARSQARPVPSGAVELGLLAWGGHAVLGVVLQVP